MTSDEIMRQKIVKEIESWRNSQVDKELEIEIGNTKIIFNKKVEKIA